MTLSLQRINEIASGLRKHKSLKSRRITMDEARANNISLNRNRLGRRYPRWYLLPGTPCYLVKPPKKRPRIKVRR